MVAYSFRPRFVDPIRVGLNMIPGGKLCGPKLHTIRADRKRHARPGEELQFYCGMRTPKCFLIGRARCRDVRPITITFGSNPVVRIGLGKLVGDIGGSEAFLMYRHGGLDMFAIEDGFASWEEMRAFWAETHAGGVFVGRIIYWEPLA